MHKSLILLATLVPAIATAWESSDFHPNPAFVPMHLRADSSLPGVVEQVGEVVILQGDDDLVSSDGMGGYGIDVQMLGQPLVITGRFFSRYADEFDEIIVFTTFDDIGAQGAAAYEISSVQDVQGIGRPLTDDSRQWGASGKRFHAFVNMMRWDNYAGLGQGLLDPTNYMYRVLGQEFAHRWLSFFHYKDASGNISSAMLGRDESHWATTMQTNASVMDGSAIEDDGGGNFLVTETFQRFSPLDLYGMGLIDASEVPPWFIVNNAVSATSGRALSPSQLLRKNLKLTGTREDITMDQVLAAEGPRVPAPKDSDHAFRVAFVLLTRPGERVDDDQVLAAARTLDQARLVWEQRFSAMTGGRGVMCTQVSAPCGAAIARIDGGTVSEVGGNDNHVVEPGEDVLVQFRVTNPSTVTAHSIDVVADSDLIASTDADHIDTLAPADVRPAGFLGHIPSDAACGQSITISAKAQLDGHVFRGFTQVTPGLKQLALHDFETGNGGYTLDGTVDNGWAWGTPEAYSSQYGLTYQPGSGHVSKKAWFTGLGLGHARMTDSSLAVGSSRLRTPPLDLAGTYQPALRYFAWYEAIDYSDTQQGGQVASNQLVVEGSLDGGQTWIPLDTVDGVDPSWRERIVPLAGKLPASAFTAGKLIVRFTASNDSPTTVVEAGIDDVELRTLTQACNPDAPPPATTPPAVEASGGCAMAGRGPAPAFALLAIAILALVARRRRA